MRLLLLGGTGEARALAAALDPDPAIEVISSLAGRVSNPALPVGTVRMGGFGGVPGMVAYLRAEQITAVVDATHPFAATMSHHAAQACTEADVPLLALRRPGWTERDGDNWTRVPDIETAAANASTASPGSVFLTTGKRDLAAFAGDPSHHYLVRVVDPPQTRLPPSHTLILGRGPYTLDGERALFVEHDVSLLITKDSGGSMTAAKLDAARQLTVPVLIVDRPPLPDGVESVETVAAAVAWISRGNGAG